MSTYSTDLVNTQSGATSIEDVVGELIQNHHDFHTIESRRAELKRLGLKPQDSLPKYDPNHPKNQFPKMVYHKSFETADESSMGRTAKTVRSQAELEELGPDWFESIADAQKAGAKDKKK